MKQAVICKTLEGGDLTDAQLEAINRYTRRALARDEVFVFSVVLCDNEIDRDLERFPVAALEKLGELFLGKTGVFDHAAKAENQSARIFETRLEQGEELNSLGEPYCRLRAWAYMVRCDKNSDLILEIDAGIKKEVSVGCAVDSILCSICGEDQKGGGCSHEKGETYGDTLCHHLLVSPADAYEWSFVAVPAQKNAGVIKRLGGGGEGEATVAVAKARLQRLEGLARAGERYETELRKSVVRLGLLGQPEMTADTLNSIADKLDIPQLEALEKTFGRAAAKRYPVGPQLAPQTEPEAAGDGEFRI